MEHPVVGDVGREGGASAWRVVALSLALSAGCGGKGGSGYATSTGGTTGGMMPTFSELELAVIRDELGSLPAQPPSEPTNRYADDPGAAALGQKFFFEARFSPNGQISCATCHIPDKGFRDDRGNVSQGIDFAKRHTPTLLNVAFGSGKPGATVWQFWDGRKDSLWSQATAPLESPIEMGSSRTQVALVIYDKYKTDYEAVFGAMPALRDDGGTAVAPMNAMPAGDGSAAWQALSPMIQDEITQVFVNFGKAVAAYERKLVSGNSRFDRFFADITTNHADDSDQLTKEEKEGLKVFVGAGRCASCHRGPNFTDGDFHNTGVMQSGDHIPAQDNGRQDGVTSVKNDEFNCASRWSDREDKSKCEVMMLAAGDDDLGAFKTPGLRNLSATPPYFHTGGVAILADVVDFYDKGGDGSGYVGSPDPNIGPLMLTDEQKQRLVDFLGALDGEPLSADLTTAPNLPN